MSAIVPCAHCGAELKHPPSDFKGHKHHFCNLACKGAYLSRHVAGKNHHQWTSIDIPCAVCGKIVQRRPSQMKSRAHVFCNRACYCTYQSIHKTGSNNHNWGGVAVPCDYCGTMISHPPSQANANKHQFCNKTCHGAYLALHTVGNAHHLWKGGRIDYYGPNWRMQKRAARKRDKYTCQACGKKPKKRALDVHHIKPFRSFGYKPGINETYLQANDLTNLISLCNKCHMQAECGKIAIQPYLL